jgi:hypothetical protein
VIHFLIRLYPAAWRRRYGDEFEVLLGERALGPFDVADVFVGAIDAHLHMRDRETSRTPVRNSSMSIRVSGLAAIASGVLWSVVSLGLLGVIRDDDLAITAAVFVAASVTVLVALVGLSAFQAREDPRLVWSAFVIPAVGCIITMLAMVAGLRFGDAEVLPGIDTWVIWMLGVLATVGGSAIFAIATWRTNVLSRPSAAALGIGGGGVALALLLSAAGGSGGNPDILIVGPLLALYCVGWVGLGFRAMRGGRLIPEAAPVI